VDPSQIHPFHARRKLVSGDRRCEQGSFNRTEKREKESLHLRDAKGGGTTGACSQTKALQGHGA